MDKGIVSRNRNLVFRKGFSWYKAVRRDTMADLLSESGQKIFSRVSFDTVLPLFKIRYSNMPFTFCFPFSIRNFYAIDEHLRVPKSAAFTT